MLISVGITDLIDKDLLRELSSSPQQEGVNYFTAADFSALDEIRQTVVSQTCGVLDTVGKFNYNNFNLHTAY